ELAQRAGARGHRAAAGETAGARPPARPVGRRCTAAGARRCADGFPQLSRGAGGAARRSRSAAHRTGRPSAALLLSKSRGVIGSGARSGLRIAVIGGGRWARALAQHLAHTGGRTKDRIASVMQCRPPLDLKWTPYIAPSEEPAHHEAVSAS